MAFQPQLRSTAHLDSLHGARAYTLALISDLTDEQLMGPRLEIVNPLLWEIGHVAWFQEYWVLRHLNGHGPILPNGDALYDSANVAHDTRWDLPLPTREQTLAYMHEVLDRITDRYQHEKEIDAQAEYFLSLALFHEDMHDEAFGYTRQTLSYPKPYFDLNDIQEHQNASLGKELGDARIPGGRFLMGSLPDRPFVFDNEMDAHEVEVEPFSISRTAVTNAEFAAFVDDRGYERKEFWSEEGWRWRQSVNAKHPVYWRREGNDWILRKFDRFVTLESVLPVLHVNWFEADAYCRWGRRRLPTEAEWEMAASGELNSDGNSVSERKRRFPWGNAVPTPNHANLDWRSGGSIDVRALPESDSAFGCRQMIGNVWEWTVTDFNPYPGFKAGPYKEYSAPWFGDHKVLRGGCWATRSQIIHNGYRNFYKPDRRDVWAGFRTCAL
ncbi:MAG: ergothioneine biosynthesis protein EgtB [Acidobacteria bacterium]|nr:MAG: ergothioneine biosynthesis protein EgtB [Acidobacteriota bacterium]